MSRANQKGDQMVVSAALTFSYDESIMKMFLLDVQRPYGAGMYLDKRIHIIFASQSRCRLSASIDIWQ
jgi:hypothetical protein